MKITKFVALAAVAAATLGLSACASKKDHHQGYSSTQHSSAVGYSK